MTDSRRTGLRALHVGKYYAPVRGGIERHTQTLAEWCAAHGDDVAVLVHQAPGRWRGSRETIGGVEVTRAGCLAAPVYTPLSPAFPLEFSRLLRDFRPDILHLHMPNPSCFAALLLPAARRLPWIVHWHADVPPDSPDWRLRTFYRLYEPFERALLRRARAIVATSQPYRDASTALARWKNKTHVVPLGIADAGARTTSGTAPAWPRSDGTRLLAVGRLSRYKGFDVLIEALARRDGTTLLLVGDGECRRELRELASARGVDARIRFAGNLDDDALAAAYADADAFVLPSLDRGEAFGMVLLEAMRAGLPTIASDIPGSGIAAVVVDGGTGLLVPPGDADALATAIDRLGDVTLRSRLGAAGRARWQAEFTLEKSARAIRALQSLRPDRA